MSPVTVSACIFFAVLLLFCTSSSDCSARIGRLGDRDGLWYSLHTDTTSGTRPEAAGNNSRAALAETRTEANGQALHRNPSDRPRQGSPHLGEADVYDDDDGLRNWRKEEGHSLSGGVDQSYPSKSSSLAGSGGRVKRNGKSQQHTSSNREPTGDVLQEVPKLDYDGGSNASVTALNESLVVEEEGEVEPPVISPVEGGGLFGQHNPSNVILPPMEDRVPLSIEVSAGRREKDVQKGNRQRRISGDNKDQMAARKSSPGRKKSNQKRRRKKKRATNKQKLERRRNCCLNGRNFGSSRHAIQSPDIFQTCSSIRAETGGSKWKTSCLQAFRLCCEVEALRIFYENHKEYAGEPS